MSDRIDELAKRAVNERSYGWERGQAVAELATIAREADIQRKRADFFRDALDALHECPPVHLDYPCKGRKGEPCPYEGDDGIDYAACWDEVERRQR